MAATVEFIKLISLEVVLPPPEETAAAFPSDSLIGAIVDPAFGAEMMASAPPGTQAIVPTDPSQIGVAVSVEVETNDPSVVTPAPEYLLRSSTIILQGLAVFTSIASEEISDILQFGVDISAIMTEVSLCFVLQSKISRLTLNESPFLFLKFTY